MDGTSNHAEDETVVMVVIDKDRQLKALRKVLRPAPDREEICQVARKDNTRLAAVDQYASNAAAAVRRAEVETAVADLEQARELAAARGVTIDTNRVTTAIRPSRHGKHRKNVRTRATAAAAGVSPSCYVFKAGRLTVAQWWPCSGTLSVAGRPAKAVTLAEALDKVLASL